MLKFKTPIDEMMNNNKLEETKKKKHLKDMQKFWHNYVIQVNKEYTKTD